MIISDLNYMESIEASELQGGGRKYRRPKYYKPRARVDLELDVLAIGKKTQVDANIEVTADAGGDGFPSVSQIKADIEAKAS